MSSEVLSFFSASSALSAFQFSEPRIRWTGAAKSGRSLSFVILFVVLFVSFVAQLRRDAKKFSHKEHKGKAPWLRIVFWLRPKAAGDSYRRARI